MTEATWIALIGVILGPAILSWLTNRNLAKMKILDWDRQDKVANRLADRQTILDEGLKNVADAAKSNATHTDGQLQQIHTLVNSNLTAALRGELSAVDGNLLALQKLAQISPSTAEESSAIMSLEKRKEELEVSLAERLDQQKVADALALEGMATIQVTGPVTQL